LFWRDNPRRLLLIAALPALLALPQTESDVSRTNVLG
jgi:hypothetical protein